MGAVFVKKVSNQAFCNLGFGPHTAAHAREGVLGFVDPVETREEKLCLLALLNGLRFQKFYFEKRVSFGNTAASWASTSSWMKDRSTSSLIGG